MDRGKEHKPEEIRDVERTTTAKVAWITITVICLIAALLLLVNGYVGYSGVLIAVAIAAGINIA